MKQIRSNFIGRCVVCGSIIGDYYTKLDGFGNVCTSCHIIIENSIADGYIENIPIPNWTEIEQYAFCVGVIDQKNMPYGFKGQEYVMEAEDIIIDGYYVGKRVPIGYSENEWF